MEIFKEFKFEAAHKLPNVPEGHQCGRLHGHSFKVRVTVSGEIDENTGWVIDFSDIKSVVKPIIDRLDRYETNIPLLRESLTSWMESRVRFPISVLGGY